jgi:formiminoglutamase
MEFPPKFHEFYEAPFPVAVRKDGDRLANFISHLDVTKHDWDSRQSSRAIAVVGFACDEGVYRNMGRRGAKEGPAAVRKVLYPLAWHDEWCCALYDFGDIVVEEGGNLLEGQRMLSHMVSVLQGHGIITLVIGGGHETAIGHYLGLERVHGDLSIINFDAHFDLRELERRGGSVDCDEEAHDNDDAYNIDVDTATHDDEYGGTSGTPFRQVARHCEKRGNPFRYSVVGIQEQANIPSLFETAAALDVRYASCYTIVLRSFLVCDVSVSLSFTHVLLPACIL